MLESLKKQPLEPFEISEKDAELRDLIQEFDTRKAATSHALRLKNEPIEKLKEGLTGFWKDLEPIVVLPTLPKAREQTNN